jgi:hypothetical protein
LKQAGLDVDGARSPTLDRLDDLGEPADLLTGVAG